jgi:hypothetical protein
MKEVALKKVIFCFALVLFLFSLSQISNAKVLGDINFDSRIDLSEAIHALQVVAGIRNAPGTIDQAQFEGSWTRPSQGRDTISLKNTRYTFTVTSNAENVDIELVGLGVNEYLYVIDDFGNTIIAEYSGVTSQPLLPGNYTLIPTTYTAGIIGNYTLSISGPISNVQAVYPPYMQLTDSISISGGRSHVSPKNVFYDFELNQKERIEIKLTGIGINEYVYLLDGFGNVIGSDYSGYLIRDLDPGKYTLVMTTYDANVSGSFSLEIWGHIPTPQRFVYPHLMTTGSVSSSGGRDPLSPDNPKYTFDVETEGYVQIEHRGIGINEYLYILDSFNNVIASDYSGNFFDVLDPGTYTIVAATYDSGITGGFTINIWGDVSNFP